METGKKSRVSVVIPTRNRAPLLVEALQSVLRVAERTREVAELEILVVDDGSTDATARLVTDYPVIYLRNTGQGVAAARNTGLRLATGEFVTFLDDNDAWAETHLVPHLALLTHNPHVDAVFGQQYYCNPSFQPTWGPTPNGAMPSGDGFLFVHHNIVALGAWVIRRRALDKVGFFNDRLISSEDWEFQVRLAARCDIHGLAVVSYLYRGDYRRGIDFAEWWARRYSDDQAEKIIGQIRGRSSLPLSDRLRRRLKAGGLRGRDAWTALYQVEQAVGGGRLDEAQEWLRAAWYISPLHTLRLAPRHWRSLLRLALVSQVVSPTKTVRTPAPIEDEATG